PAICPKFAPEWNAWDFPQQICLRFKPHLSFSSIANRAALWHLAHCSASRFGSRAVPHKK
ncbi:MAG: hypothetical protein LW689_03875, partial [Novosphingobium sp.]|nr:hypothetical protein [Novosphingobium sp.]